MRSSSDSSEQEEGRLGGKEWCEGRGRGSWAVCRRELLLSASNHVWRWTGGRTHRDLQDFHTGGSAWTSQLDEIKAGPKPGAVTMPSIDGCWFEDATSHLSGSADHQKWNKVCHN
jgi:hypothetical protein